MLWAASSLIINKENKSWEVMSDTLLLMFQKSSRQALLPWVVTGYPVCTREKGMRKWETKAV